MDKLGDRMRVYEGMESNRRFLPLLPTLARLDGRAFHTFCRGLEKPFDQKFHGLMRDVTRFLVEETGAVVGYTQSDEISLAFLQRDRKSQIFFDGRIMKMTSILAALASAKFNQRLDDRLPWKHGHLPVFDCRVWQVPNETEAANTFLWRENDAVKNSISAVGQAHFSPKQLHGKDSSEIQEMLFQERGLNWNDFEPWAKRGTWVQRTRVLRPFTAEEIEVLPAKHEARRNPNLMVERWKVAEKEMPRFGSVTNREGVIFRGEEPQVEIKSPRSPEPC